jgi:hypothetical protein
MRGIWLGIRGLVRSYVELSIVVTLAILRLRKGFPSIHPLHISLEQLQFPLQCTSPTFPSSPLTILFILMLAVITFPIETLRDQSNDAAGWDWIKNKFLEELIAYFPWYDTDRIENYVFDNSIVACVFVTEVTFLPSRCLATIQGYTYRHTDWWEGFLLGRWDGLRCRDIRTKFHKDWFRRSKVNKGDTQTHRQHGDRISLLCLSKQGK